MNFQAPFIVIHVKKDVKNVIVMKIIMLYVMNAFQDILKKELYVNVVIIIIAKNVL